MLLEQLTKTQKLWAVTIFLVATVIAETVWGAGVLVGYITMTLYMVRLGARTIHAFVQGVNEGDDPRCAKRPRDDP